MSGHGWHRVVDVRAFLSEKGNKRVRDHHTLTKQAVGRAYCAHCGLMNLKNDATRKALRQKCISYEEDE